MPKKPWQLHALSILILIACFVPWMEVVLGEPGAKLPKVERVAVYLVLSLTSFSLLRLTSVLVWLPLVVTYYVLGSDLVNHFYEPNLSSAMEAEIGLMALTLSSIMLLSSRRLRRVLLNKKFRWWLTPKRYTYFNPGHIRSTRGTVYVTKILNISSSGILMHTNAKPPHIKNLKTGDLVDIRFSVDSVKIVNCRGRVVRQELRSKGTCYGIEFIAISAKSQKAIDHQLRTSS